MGGSKNTLRMRMLKTYQGVIYSLVLLFSSIQLNAQPDGAAIFKQYCKACHSEGTDKTVGPGLKDVTTKRTKEWLKKWIKSSTELINSGDADAKKIFDEYNGLVMPDQNISDAEMDALIGYLEKLAKAEESTTPEASEVSPTTPKKKNTGNGILLLIFIAFILLGIILFLWNKFRRVQDKPSLTKAYEDQELQFKSFAGRHRKWFIFGGLFVLLFGMKTCWDAAFMVGVSQGYQPIQPIAFSHSVHAGQNQISCRYCHASAFKGKVAGIPSGNVCMNCHKYVKKGTRTGTEEIAKIYKAMDYDPQTGEYGPNPKPIEWVRVHNLPDLSYFNHAQHVVAGNVDCSKCHGEVQKMDTVFQYAPLTMAWCINCHRETEVPGMKTNPYYENLHKGLSGKYPGKKITVELMGGLDCSKCHY